MVLRDIFLELGDIFHLEFEKNPNGTYRVNTVIRALVYPSLYEGKQFGYQDVGYYLAHPDASYQGEANIRNTFTELMRPKDSSNRYPAIAFCESIDVTEMYAFYRERLAALNAEQNRLASHFIQKTMQSDSELNARLCSICREPYQAMVWIILYSMFNTRTANEKYENYQSIRADQTSGFVLAHPTTRHRLSQHLQREQRILRVATTGLLLLNILQILYIALPYTLPAEITTNIRYRGLQLSALCTSLILLLLRFWHMQLAKNYSCAQIYYDNFDNDPNILTLFEENVGRKQHFDILPSPVSNSVHRRREGIRLYMRVGVGVWIVLSTLFSIHTGGFPLMLSLTSVGIIFLAQADRSVHNAGYRKQYDALSCRPGEKLSAMRGLAKIYRHEYETTGFRRKDPYYHQPLQVHSASCFKHIFTMAYARISNFINVSTAALTAFNVIILFVAIMSVNIPRAADYLKLPSDSFFQFCITTFVLIVGIYNITTLLSTNNNYLLLAELAYAGSHAENDIRFTELTFLHLQSRGKIRELDIARGIFSYNMEFLENGQQFFAIHPESDRMLFTHIRPAFRPHLLMLVSLSFLTLFCTLVWHMHLYALTPALIVCAVASYLVGPVLNDLFYRFRLKRAIAKLQTEDPITSDT